jgi:hypothetical protein
MDPLAPTAPAAGPGRGGLRDHVRFEDGLLVGWLVFVEGAFGSARADPRALGGPDPATGVIGLVALLGFVACLAARSRPGVESGLVRQGEVLYAVGPLFGAFALTFDETRDNVGLGDNAILLTVAPTVVVAIVVRRFVGPLDSLQRRLLVTPFILVTTRFFGDVASGLADVFDLRRLAADAAAEGLPWTTFVVAMATLGLLVFYVMFVFAPRQVAEREGTTRTWAVRYLLFITATVVGQTAGGVIRPG